MTIITGTYTDLYQLSMAQVYFLKGQHEVEAQFDYFFRSLPFGGGYAVFAGLDVLLDLLQNLCFSKEDIAYLQRQGFAEEFLQYLKDFRFKGSLSSCREGEVIFANEPVVTVKGSLLEVQLIETLLLNVLNFQTLIATKASRMCQVAQGRTLIEFGLRRAQGLGGYWASRAAVIGGFEATSHVRAGMDFDVPVSGTMAHSFVQSYDSELQAFRDYASCWPDECVLLVDTYNTLRSGVPNAIKVALEMRDKGHELKAIRLDSGDLGWLAKKARTMLDEAGLPNVQIIASNQLDEDVIKDLLDHDAPIDVFGVGTHLVIGEPDSALDGVYKLAFANGKPRIKLSDTFSKITIPYEKQVYRLLEEDNRFHGADVITLVDEEGADVMHHPFEPSKCMAIKHFQKQALLQPVMQAGMRLHPSQSLKDIAQYSQKRLRQLPDEYRRFINPHLYKIGLSTLLKTKRDQLIDAHSG